MKEKELRLITPAMIEQLKAGFPCSAYKPIPGKTYLTTLKAYFVTERLNDVFGPGRWTVDHEIVKETDSEVLMKGKIILSDYDVNLPVVFGSGRITGKNIVLADGYKSAITDIVSKSASFLYIGHKMFKGLIGPDGREKQEPPKENPYNNINKVYENKKQNMVRQTKENPIIRNNSQKPDPVEKEQKEAEQQEKSERAEKLRKCIDYLKTGNDQKLTVKAIKKMIRVCEVETPSVISSPAFIQMKKDVLDQAFKRQSEQQQEQQLQVNQAIDEIPI